MTGNTDLKLMQEILQHNWRGEQERLTIHASKVGSCIRKTWYQMNDTPIDGNIRDWYPKDKFVMSWGDSFEFTITRYFSELGIAWHKQPLFNRRLNISGTTDPVIKYYNDIIVTECKLTHARNFSMFYNDAKKGIQPDRYYAQMQTYLWLMKLSQKIEPADYGIFIIGNRSWQRRDSVPPFFTLRCDLDDKWFDANFADGGRIPVLNSHLKDGTPPDREYSDKTKFPCSWCEFASRCWDGE